MRIAQVAPLYESVPPKLYGGTERVVSYLTEELVREGHDVSLFASGDSVTTARLFSQCPQALRLDRNAVDLFAPHIVMLEQVIQRASEFDLIHFHVDYLHFPSSRRQLVPHLTTLHGRLDIPELVPLYREFSEMPVVSISGAQRQPLPWLNWQATVHHGLPLDLYRLHQQPGNYLAFLGRICPEKRVDRAIEIARRSGMKLRIAAKVDKVDREYFRDEIKPLLDQPFIEFIGEIGDHEKGDFLGQALAVMAPVDWPEPFGMVMIEAMACGTPVIAFRRGSAAEVVDEGLTGYVVDDIGQAVEAVRKAANLDRRLCRKVFERRFSVGRMALDYTRVYEGVCQQRAAGALGGIVADYAVAGRPTLRDEAAISDTSQDATGGMEDFS